MHILILTQWFPPEPVLLIQELAETLHAFGHQVTVLTGFPNYPSGKLYPGYRIRLRQREMIGSIPVIRVPLYPDHSQSGLRRALNYLSFGLSTALLGPFVASKPDVLFVYHPPCTIGLPAYVLSRLWRIPYVYQIQDMWPETLSATGMVNNQRILSLVGCFMKWLYTQAAAICVISPGFRASLLAKEVPSEKIAVISNWADTSTYHPQPPQPDLARKLGLADRFNIMFAGNVGEAQGLETVAAAASLLSDTPDVQFVIVGDGVALPKLQASVRNRRLNNVLFLGRYTVDMMPSLYSLADVLLIHLNEDPLFRITIPSKTFAYMASGKPILAAVTGDCADTVAEAGAGLVCPPQNADALAQLVRRFHAMSHAERQAMGDNGLAAVRSRYSRERLVKEIEQVLSWVVEGRDRE